MKDETEKENDQWITSHLTDAGAWCMLCGRCLNGMTPEEAIAHVEQEWLDRKKVAFG